MKKYWTISLILLAATTLAEPTFAFCHAGAGATMPDEAPKSEDPEEKAKIKALLDSLKSAEEISPEMGKLWSAVEVLRDPKASKKSKMAALTGGLAAIDAQDKILAAARTNLDLAEKTITPSDWKAFVEAHQSAVDAARAEFKARMREAGPSDDPLANFEISDLLDRTNQADTTASELQQQLNEIGCGVIQRIP